MPLVLCLNIYVDYEYFRLTYVKLVISVKMYTCACDHVSYIYTERERDRDRDRDRETETERQRDRETERDRERQRETETETETETERQRQRETETERQRQRERQREISYDISQYRASKIGRGGQRGHDPRFFAELFCLEFKIFSSRSTMVSAPFDIPWLPTLKSISAALQ